mgnify:CR=1 FL=1
MTYNMNEFDSDDAGNSQNLEQMTEAKTMTFQNNEDLSTYLSQQDPELLEEADARVSRDRQAEIDEIERRNNELESRHYSNENPQNEYDSIGDNLYERIYNKIPDKMQQKRKELEDAQYDGLQKFTRWLGIGKREISNEYVLDEVFNDEVKVATKNEQIAREAYVKTENDYNRMEESYNELLTLRNDNLAEYQRTEKKLDSYLEDHRKLKEERKKNLQRLKTEEDTKNIEELIERETRQLNNLFKDIKKTRKLYDKLGDRLLMYKNDIKDKHESLEETKDHLNKFKEQYLENRSIASKLRYLKQTTKERKAIIDAYNEMEKMDQDKEVQYGLLNIASDITSGTREKPSQHRVEANRKNKERLDTHRKNNTERENNKRNTIKAMFEEDMEDP